MSIGDSVPPTGFSDSHWVRDAFDTVAYGFAPVFSMDPDAYTRGIHSADESIAVDDLAEMAAFHLHAIEAMSVGTGPPGAGG